MRQPLSLWNIKSDAALLLVFAFCFGGCARKPPATATPSTPKPAPDRNNGGLTLNTIEGMLSNGVLTLRARFEQASFDARTTRVAWVLDTDHNPATGSPGLFGAPGVLGFGIPNSLDQGMMGAEAVAVLAGTCGMGSLISYDSLGNKWALADLLPAIVVHGGFDSYVVLDSIAAKEADIRFKAVCYRFSGDCPPRSIPYDVKGILPEAGAAASRVQERTADLANPQPASPADGAVFDSFPRTTSLKWSVVPGAAGYLVQAQYADPTGGDGWRPLVLRRVSDPAIEFDFVGAQPGRWRVWALSTEGLAGRPSPWLAFRYLR